ncbi:MAG: hypothetical protein IKI11_02300 [Neisseriaceae bacterium]|nr:hypothetical protein [Neisseriaceae bacterium]
MSVIGWAFQPTTTPIGVDYALFFLNISPYRANGGQECPPYNICIYF